MREAEPGGVQRDAVERRDQVKRDGTGLRSFGSSSVGSVPEQRMPERSQMDPYLMRASGLQPTLEERDAAEALQHAKPRHRTLAPAFPGHSHPHPRALVAADGLVDDPARRLDRSMREAHVASRHAAASELR